MQLNSSCHFLDSKHCSNELQSIPFIDMELNIVMLLFIQKKKKMLILWPASFFHSRAHRIVGRKIKQLLHEILLPE